MLTEIEAYEWAIYFKIRAEEMKNVADDINTPIKSKHLFVFR
jgi:hypothetical protein